MTDPKPRGRPKKNPEDRQVQRVIGMLPALWEKVDEHGGQPWLRAAVKASKLKPLTPKPPAKPEG